MSAEKPKCRCGHNARWHGKQGECLAVTCDCERYVPVKTLERAA